MPTVFPTQRIHRSRLSNANACLIGAFGFTFGNLARIENAYTRALGTEGALEMNIVQSFNRVAKDCFKMGCELGRLVKVVKRNNFIPRVDVIQYDTKEEAVRCIAAQIGRVDLTTLGEYGMVAPVIEGLVHSTTDWLISRPVLAAVKCRFEFGERVENEFLGWARDIYKIVDAPSAVDFVIVACALIKRVRDGFLGSLNSDAKLALRDVLMLTVPLTLKVC